MNKLLSVIQPLFGNNPRFYEMSCPKCGWKETLELDPCEMDVITLDGESSRNPRNVTRLPRQCPKCNTVLNKKKLPLSVIN